jgi:MFS family permease
MEPASVALSDCVDALRCLSDSRKSMKLLAPDLPFAPARLPFFYGWWIVVVATVGIVMSIPGQTMGVSVFTDHLLAVTGLSRLQLSMTYLIGTLLSSLLLPRGGSLLDRHGSRAISMAACLMMAATLCVLTQIDGIARGLGRAVGAASSLTVYAGVLTLCFALLRFSGQGMLTMSSRTMLTKWFERRRGLASGIAGVFISFGFASAPPILQAMIELTNWRVAWLGLAAAAGLGMTTLAWLFYRDNPEECGLTMDGRPVSGGGADDDERSEIVEEPSYTRANALRTAGFWSVTIALSINAMVYTGITFHIVDLGNDAGIGGPAAVRLFLPIAAVSTVLGLASGWAADRMPIRALLLVFLAAQSLGFVAAGSLGDPVFVPLMILGWGVSSGLFGTILSVALPNFFGREHLGAIASVQMSCMVAGSAVGPAFLAAAKDASGSYHVGLLLCSGLSGLAFLFSAFAPMPPHKFTDREPLR